ncbi:MAG: MMPL family transporter [Pseudomonadota bacterium]
MAESVAAGTAPDTPTVIERYGRWLTARPWHVTLASIVLITLVSSGVTRLKLTNDFRAFFGPDNPELVELTAFEETYERQQNVTFLLIAPDATVFTANGIRLISALTDAGWQVPYSRRVTSLTNFQHTRADGDDLIVAALYDGEIPLDATTLQRIRKIALSEPSLVNRFVSRTGEAAVVSVAVTLPPADANANGEVVAFAKSAADRLGRQFPGIEIAIGGTTTTDVTLGEAVQRDIRELILLSYLVIICGLLLLLRHVGGVIATLLVISPSIVMTMGVFGWMGATLEPTAGFVPSIVMTIAVADSVHMLAAFYYEMRRGRDREAAVIEALRVNANPIALTSITTAIGVLMLNFSDSPPYNELGNMIAVGVVWAWALSMTFLPALLLMMPLRHPGRGRALEARMDRLAEVLIRRRKAFLIGMSIVVIAIASLIPRNEIGEQWHAYFDETFAAQRAIDAYAEYMGGQHFIQYNLRAGEDDGINDPTYLREVEAFATWLEAQPEVTDVDRITELLARLNMNLHGDDPAMRALPHSRDLAAQLLLMYELSLPLGMGLENTVNVARSGSRMTVTLKRTTSEKLLAFDARAMRWVATHAPSLKVAQGTGIDLIFAHINHRNIRSLLFGMALALVLISALLMVALRSLKLGMLSLVTNLAPAGLAYGTWAVFDGLIDLSASVVICMSIGIVVDDTVHFLSKYRRARREGRQDAANSLRYTFHTVGVALTITTAVLVAGFSVLTASHFSPTETTGALMAITLAYALLVDFLLLPPLLLMVDADNQPVDNAAHT